MKIIFYANTLYQLFIAHLVRVTEYSCKEEVVLLADALIIRQKGMIERLRKIGYWTSVIELGDSNTDEEQINDFLDKNNLKDFDILHITDLFDRWANIVYHNRKNTQAHIFLNEEGVGTYMLDEFSLDWRSKFIDKADKYTIFPIKKIEGIFFLDTRIAKVNGIKKKNIELYEVFDWLKNKNGLQDLNYIYDYQYPGYIMKNVFFDAYLNMQRVIGNDYQRHLIDRISANLNEVLYYKRHPGEIDESKISGLKNIKEIHTKTPWEIVFLNELMYGEKQEERTYFTYVSTAAMSCFAFARQFDMDINIRSVFLYPIINRISYKKIFINQNILKNYQMYYGTDCVKVIDSLEYFCNNNFQKKEIQWFEQNYQKTYKMLCGLPEKTHLKVFFNSDFFSNQFVEQCVEYKISDHVYLRLTIPQQVVSGIAFLLSDDCLVQIENIELQINNTTIDADIIDVRPVLGYCNRQVVFLNYKGKVNEIHIAFDIRDIKRIDFDMFRLEVHRDIYRKMIRSKKLSLSDERKYMIYGGGIVTRDILNEGYISVENVCAIVDQYSNVTEVCGIPLIKSREIPSFVGPIDMIVTTPQYWDLLQYSFEIFENIEDVYLITNIL